MDLDIIDTTLKTILGSLLVIFRLLLHRTIVPSVSSRRTCEITRGTSGTPNLFLPAYSSQLNMRELLFSKWKHSVKSLNPNISPELLNVIKAATTEISQRDCQAWF
ncbi:hypothetical protein RF11_04729 [Thelohanellus kitauei]|uniref:Tc1-like transposase DDE domain-containing protein n=1 Tax=Thelohanellus kitauei TaxID=669202 RepID=A0A0C2IVI1_THEKT|nr:hypothetical protein RF11_04729 [Thelohanellus kitauei]